MLEAMLPIVCLDVGGSSVKAAVTTVENPVPDSTTRYELDSRASADTIVDRLAEIVRREAERVSHPFAVGMGFPGPCDYEAGVCYLRGLTKFEALYGLSVLELLRERLGLAGRSAVRMRNDAEAAILGEALYGVGQDTTPVLGLTLGTGMGSSLINRREVVRFSTPYGERDELFPWPVHDPADRRSAARRQADDVFSTRGLMRLAESAGLAVSSPLELAGLAGNHDSRALETYRTFGRRLGEFLTEVIEHLGAHTEPPRLVILLGGITGAFEFFAPAVRDRLPVPVVQGRLGEAAAIAGITELFAE